MALLWYRWIVPRKSVPERVHRKSDEERREELIKVLVTVNERALLQAAADAAGMTLSTWLRHIGLTKARSG